MRILIVEDDGLIGMAMADAMQKACFDVEGPVATISEALQRITDCQLDVAIVDAGLKGESAAPVGLSLRAKGVPFVVVSGYDASILAPWLGDAPLISKPYRQSRLIGEVMRLSAHL